MTRMSARSKAISISVASPGANGSGSGSETQLPLNSNFARYRKQASCTTRRNVLPDHGRPFACILAQRFVNPAQHLAVALGKVAFQAASGGARTHLERLELFPGLSSDHLQAALRAPMKTMSPPIPPSSDKTGLMVQTAPAGGSGLSRKGAQRVLIRGRRHGRRGADLALVDA